MLALGYFSASTLVDLLDHCKDLKFDVPIVLEISSLALFSFISFRLWIYHILERDVVWLTDVKTDADVCCTCGFLLVHKTS